MRIGFNPHKDQPQEDSEFIHQIIIPVYIPNHDGYFKESFRIFKLCLKSLLATVHDKTFITIVNNGSDKIVTDFLDGLFTENTIHELIHTHNIGKINAILKGLAGNNIELVTITDSDVMFLPDWQIATNKIYAAFPKAGVVGIVPQIRTFSTFCSNILFDYWFNKKLKFVPLQDPDALLRFYKSVGWENCNPVYLKYTMGFESNGVNAIVGSGHFVATYKKDMFDEIVTYNNFKMGGRSEDYLDASVLKKDYWRLTTCGNHAYHMGNVHEDWMDEISFDTDEKYIFQSDFPTFKKISRFEYYIKNTLFRRFYKEKWVRRLFYRFKKLPSEMVKDY